MKKKLLVVLCSMVMALVIPTLAFAAPSPTDQQTAEYPAVGVSAKLVGSIYSLNDLHIDPMDETAATIDTSIKPKLDSDNVVVGMYSIYGTHGVTDNFGTLTLTFQVDPQYNGRSAVVYQLHDGSLIAHTGVVSGGTISITITQLSEFAVVVDANAATTNTGATSPKTGSDVNGIVLAMSFAAIAACGVFFVLRERKQH